jgi:hypothetical protein
MVRVQRVGGDRCGGDGHVFINVEGGCMQLTVLLSLVLYGFEMFRYINIFNITK